MTSYLYLIIKNRQTQQIRKKRNITKQNCNKVNNSNIINDLVGIATFVTNTKQQTKLKKLNKHVDKCLF